MTILRTAATFALLLFTLNQLSFATENEAGSPDRPNIILIMADDLGAECIGTFGALDYKTPVLDQMAADGVRFSRCFSTPLCTPSRVQLMTGRYTHRNYVSFGKFPQGEVTFGNMLQDVGYATCMVGKWQLGGDHQTPHKLGFDEYCLQNGMKPATPFDRKSRGRERHWGYPVVVANGELYESEERYGPDMLNEYARDFIRRKKDQPFFLYYPMILPHSPFTPSPLSEDGDKSGAKTSEVKYFGDMVEYIDVLVGNIHKTLDQEGIRENTIVMFTGDNGTTYPVTVTKPAPADFPKVVGIKAARHRSQFPQSKELVLDPTKEGPLTRTDHGDIPGGKDLMSQRGVHVPLIIDWPRYRDNYEEIGHCNDGLVDFTDFVPTLCELTGAKMPHDRTMDGESLVSALKGETAETDRNTVFCHYWEFGRKQDRARTSIHDKHLKLYDNGDFFDLDRDTEESHPLEMSSLDENAQRIHKSLTSKMADILAPETADTTPQSNDPKQANPKPTNPTANSQRSPKPNVVLIYSDDHGWGDVGYHGYDDILTPNIDKLAAGGTQFSQGYVCASVCGPSRAGLLTGVYQQRMGVYGNYDKGGIPTSQPTIFEMLKDQGYATAAIGKWHVGMETQEQRPNSRGVDFFYGFLSGSHDYYESTVDPQHQKASLRPIMRNTQIEPPIQDSDGYLTEMFTNEAVDFIGKTDDEPFFLYLAYNAVHHPWSVPDSYVTRVQGLDTHDERKLFAGMVLAMDDGVGAVMDALRKKGIDKETLVIFMSDNGSPRGQGIAQPKQKTRGQTTMSSPGPLNGFKGDTYEGGIRVPMVIHWPANIPAGKTYPHPVTNLDLVPTIMARCGVDNPKQGIKFDGVDLLPYLRDKNSKRPHDLLYWRRGDDYAIRQGDWKLSWNDQAGPQTIRLFDLANDPGEWKDLSPAKPERAQSLQNMFDQWDSQLPDNQARKNPGNRNAGYATGDRVDVAKFNSRIAAKESEKTKRRSSGANPVGVSLKEKLSQAESKARIAGKSFDAARTTRWFRAKDRNNDGMLNELELKTKAPKDWNKELDYKNPILGKPQPIDEPNQFTNGKSRSMSKSSDGLAAEKTDINARDTSAQKEADLEYLAEPIVSIKPSDLSDGIAVGSLASTTCDQQAIRSLMEAVASSKYENIDSLLIAHKGTLVLESYYRRGRPDVPHYQMSITKSVTALALGRAVQLGYIKDLNTPVVDYLNGVDRSVLASGAAEITITECLNMHSGIRIPEAKAKAAARRRDKVEGQGQAQMILSTTDAVTAKSKEYKYQGTDPTLVMQVVEAIVPGSAEDFIRTEVLKPLGITNYSWQPDVSGFPKAAAGSSLRSRDMLKLGLLIADNGKWQGQQLWPAEFIKTAVSPLYTNKAGDTYGYFWWGSEMEVAGRKHHCISARGAGGQFIFIVPAMDLAVVVTSHNKGKAMRLPFQLMKNELLPAFVAE